MHFLSLHTQEVVGLEGEEKEKGVLDQRVLGREIKEKVTPQVEIKFRAQLDQAHIHHTHP